MIPEQFQIDAMPMQGATGVAAYGVDLPCVACEGCGAIVVVALLDRHPHAVKLHKGAPAVPLVKLTEPKPPVDTEALEEWRRAALEKWRHYRDVVRPSGNIVACAIHEGSLVKMIPYLLGMPEEALQDDTDALYGPNSGIMPDTEPKPERIVKPTTKRERK